MTLNGRMHVLGGWLVLACSDTRSVSEELEGYRRARGELVEAETTAATPRGRYAAHGVRLRSNNGLAGTGRLFAPRRGDGCYPAVLLQDGREENSGVIERLPADFGDVVVLSLDYPEEFPYVLGRGELLRSDRLKRPAQRVPPLFLLASQYLSTRADVDPTRIVLAATSFAVPFATIAAAAEPRFANVALIYGAGDLAAVVAANLHDVPRVVRKPLAALAIRPFGAFAPERFIPLVAPRPLVMVNGRDDPQMPPNAAQRLYDHARDPKVLIWLRTGHLMPTDSALIRSLIDTALARLPALQDAPAAGCRAR